jgi:putative ubiquitin-RnfH superfamily antitoxin RatB of RatAB toxin-antitoxin module
VNIEVVLAWPRRAESVRLAVPPGTTAGEAVARSGLGTDGVVALAVHGVRVEPGAVLRDGDRVELLRPLQVDPKEARRRRAARPRSAP